MLNAEHLQMPVLDPVTIYILELTGQSKKGKENPSSAYLQFAPWLVLTGSPMVT